MKHIQQSRLDQSESGQAMVEFALTITLTLLLIFGLIDFSRAIYTASIVQWAAQSGARAAIIEPSQAEVEEAVKERLAGLDPGLVVVSSPSWAANPVEVEVTYPFEFVAPFVREMMGGSLEMSASATMITH